MKAKTDVDRMEALARARDEVLDQWLANCSPEERKLTARWLAEGVGAEFMPKPLIRAQQALMEKLNGEDAEVSPNAES